MKIKILFQILSKAAVQITTFNISFENFVLVLRTLCQNLKAVSVSKQNR